MKSCRIIILSLMITSLTKAALALPVQNSYSSTKQQVEPFIDTPICYMRTANGGILDLSSLCEAKPGTTVRIPSRQAMNVYNYTRTNKFDRELYGE